MVDLRYKSPFKDLDGGFKYFFVSPQFGQDSQFDQYSSKGLKRPIRDSLVKIGSVYLFKQFWEGRSKSMICQILNE